MAADGVAFDQAGHLGIRRGGPAGVPDPRIHHGGGAPVRERPGDQPLPVPNDSESVHSLVVADILARKALGLQRYGSLLQAHNGRDAFRDLYEELLDAACYVRQIMEERKVNKNTLPGNGGEGVLCCSDVAPGEVGE